MLVGMPKYRAVVKVRLRDELRAVTAFNKQQAEDYFWAQVGDEGQNLDLELMDFADLDVDVYEVPE